MSRKRILWLCSWYPDRNQPFNGDFIQRHARAAAIFNDIAVFHLAQSDAAKGDETYSTITPGLTETIHYYKPATGFLSRWKNYNRWIKAYKKALRNYMKAEGKPDLVHVHVPMRDGLLAMKLKRMYKLPYIVTEHWTIYQPGNIKTYEEQPGYLRSLTYWIIRNSSLLLPVSEDLGKMINKLVCPKDFRVIDNVADTTHFYFKEQNPAHAAFRFLHVSNFTFQKNAEAIIESFAELQKKHSTVELVLVGLIPPEVEKLITASGLKGKNIILKGEISYPEVAQEMQEANALVMFSRYENSPCTIIEALCCGLPVIASSVGGIPELIHSGNGLLVTPGDKELLFTSMEKMIENYSSFDRAAISADAMSRFSYPVVGKKIDQVYSQLLKKD
jgi:glycosyltransferase involved in cell wall biosynthesis